MLPRNFLLRGAYGHRPLPCIQGKLGQRAKGTKAPRPRGAGVVPPSKLHVQTVFDAFTPILDATDVAELKDAITNSVTKCLPQVERLVVFLKNPITEEIESTDEVLPTQGVIWDSFQDCSLHIDSVPPDPDPVLDLLHLHSSDSSKILLLPLSSTHSEHSLGIIVACFKGDGLSIEEEKYLHFLQKQVSVVYKAVQQQSLELTGTDQLESLMRLCGNLHDQDAASLELKVIRYLREQTDAESGFLLLVVPETLELISQVVGNTILPEEVRFPGLWSCFARALETKHPMTLEHIPQERRGEVEKIVEMKARSFLCVPVARKGSEDLLALACLVNKVDGNKFSDTDIQIVRQCFTYTATVLTSTLAFQNERKLKNQTQALLHVARKLFTRLGECNEESDKQSKETAFVFSVTRFLHTICFRHLDKEVETEPDNKSSSVRGIQGQYGEIKTEGARLSDASKIGKIEGARLSDAGKIGMIGKTEGERLSDARRISKTEGARLSDARKISKMPRKKKFQCLGGTVIDDQEKHPEAHKSLSDEEVNAGSAEEALKRFQEKRNRKMSQSFYYLYDPTIPEPDSTFSEDSESSSEESFSPVNSNQCYISMESSSSTDQKKTRWFSPSLANIDENAERFHFKNIFSPIVSNPFCKPVDSPPSSSSTNPMHKSSALPNSQLTKRASSPNSQLTKRASSPNSQLTKRAPSPNSQLSKRAPSLSKESRRQSRMLPKRVCKRVPFSYLRSQPARNFALQDGSISPFIEWIRRNAPADASYSDGDFIYDLTKLLREIMQEARNLTNSERCSVFLIDQDSDELVATVFDGITTNNKEWQLRNGVQSEIRLPKTQGIAGHVATTGTLLNIKDAYSHPLFYRGIDDSTGFRTRNILCFPIKDEEGVVLGVAQLCNKKTGTYFTTFDEDIASAFAVYCCISISHSLMYKKVIDIQYRNSLANELMMFHMKCLIYKKLQDTIHRYKIVLGVLKHHMLQIPMEEVQELANQDLPRVQVFHKDFNMFSFPPRQLTETRTPAACRAMFEDLGFISRWRLKSDTLARFLLMVKKGYRNPPYHNWMHAFSVAHFGYLCIKNLQLVTYLEDIELFALFVSCLCHDIDHRGTTNSFQVKSQSVLAALYSSEGSVMERHHLAQSMCILNTEGSNIFENLSSKEYQQVLDLMRDIILATDVAHHLRIFSSLEEMATNGYTRTDPKCRNLLLCLLMTASDLSDQTKTWDNTKHIAVLIYQEFFSQGDLEKALGESPLEMMDRERACVPDLQISFLDNIAIPVYRVLAMVFPQAKSVQECVLNNRKHWERKAQLMKVHNNAAQTMSVQEIIALGEEEEVKLDTNQHNGR